MKVVGPKYDLVLRWLRRGWWYVLSFALAIGSVVALFLVPVFLIGCLVGLLRGMVPSVSTISTDRMVLISLAVSLILTGAFIHTDRRKWHIGERLTRLREGNGDHDGERKA